MLNKLVFWALVSSFALGLGACSNDSDDNNDSIKELKAKIETAIDGHCNKWQKCGYYAEMDERDGLENCNRFNNLYLDYGSKYCTELYYNDLIAHYDDLSTSIDCQDNLSYPISTNVLKCYSDEAKTLLGANYEKMKSYCEKAQDNYGGIVCSTRSLYLTYYDKCSAEAIAYFTAMADCTADATMSNFAEKEDACMKSDAIRSLSDIASECFDKAYGSDRARF